ARSTITMANVVNVAMTMPMISRPCVVISRDRLARALIRTRREPRGHVLARGLKVWMVLPRASISTSWAMRLARVSAFTAVCMRHSTRVSIGRVDRCKDALGPRLGFQRRQQVFGHRGRARSVVGLRPASVGLGGLDLRVARRLHAARLDERRSLVDVDLRPNTTRA